MNGLQAATWVILGATLAVNAYTLWMLRKAAKLRRTGSGWEK